MKRLVIALALALTTGTMAGCTQSGPDLAKSKDKSSDQADTGQTQAGTISPGIAQAGRKTENELILTLKTGKVVIKLLPNLAPKHVARIKRLARKGFYNGIVFHRVIAGFMAQTGDPTGTGRGGSKLPDLPAEFSKYVFKRGTVGAARSASPNSANSQFFICFGSGCAGLTGQYTVWGQVIKGMENVDKIKLGEPPRNPDKMISLQVAADVKQ